MDSESMFLRMMQMIDRPSVLSPPSYTARAVRNDSVLRKALRSIKSWKREYVGGVLADTCGLFHVTASGGGPRFMMRFRSGSRTGDLALIDSAGDFINSFLSCSTSCCR